MTPAATARLAKTAALDAGFDLVGIVRPQPPLDTTYYRAWLAAGYAGSMEYLHHNVVLRENPTLLLPNARSIICVGLSYNRPTEPTAPTSTATGRVARYARGVDYHRVVRQLLERLDQHLRELVDQPFESRAFVDTAPLLERQLAAAAGLGWIGKNTLVLNERIGSYFFLGELLTTLDLTPDAPASDHCGTCTRCLDACPTGALVKPHQMDASRCISYLTIEHRGDVPGGLATGIGDWVFGCDICQEVCPFNAKAPAASNSDITGDRVPARLVLLDLINLRSSAYRRLTRGTTVGRASRKMLSRNAAIALANEASRDE